MSSVTTIGRTNSDLTDFGIFLRPEDERNIGRWKAFPFQLEQNEIKKSTKKKPTRAHRNRRSSSTYRSIQDFIIVKCIKGCIGVSISVIVMSLADLTIRYDFIMKTIHTKWKIQRRFDANPSPWPIYFKLKNRISIIYSTDQIISKREILHKLYTRAHFHTRYYTARSLILS